MATGGSRVLLFLENWLIFRPTPARKGWVEPPNRNYHDVELTSVDGTRLHAWWCPPEDWQPAHGAVLYSHGVAGNLSYRGQQALRWQAEPLRQAVLLYDYPGYGKSAGRPSEAGCYAAADAGYDWLIREKQVAPERLLLYGGSLGGAVAAEIASRRPHRALVLVATFTSLADMVRRLYPWLPLSRLMRTQFDTLARVRHSTRPLFIAHGTMDRLVPIAHGEQLFAAAPEPKHFLRMEGLEHRHSPIPQFYTELADFLDQVERRPCPKPHAR